jgi:hypothetical protein
MGDDGVRPEDRLQELQTLRTVNPLAARVVAFDEVSGSKRAA